MTKAQVVAAILAVVGLAMILFPKVFVDLSDLRAERSGYKPDPKGEEMRSPELYRGFGVLILLIALVTLIGGFAKHWAGK